MLVLLREKLSFNNKFNKFLVELLQLAKWLYKAGNLAQNSRTTEAEMEHSDWLFYGATKMAPLVSFVCLFVFLVFFTELRRAVSQLYLPLQSSNKYNCR